MSKLPKKKYIVLIVKCLVLVMVVCLIYAGTVFASTYGEGSFSGCSYGSCSSSSGESGAPSVPTSSKSASKIILNNFDEYFTDDGKSLSLGGGQTVYFDVDSTRYGATVKTVSPDKVVLALTTTSPTVANMAIGDAIRFDVNKDGQDDIEVTLNSVTGSKAYLTFRNISEETPSSTPSPAATETPADQQMTSAKRNSYFLLITSLAVLGVGLFIFIVLYLRRRHRNQSTFPSS